MWRAPLPTSLHSPNPPGAERCLAEAGLSQLRAKATPASEEDHQERHLPTEQGCIPGSKGKPGRPQRRFLCRLSHAWKGRFSRQGFHYHFPGANQPLGQSIYIWFSEQGKDSGVNCAQEGTDTRDCAYLDLSQVLKSVTGLTWVPNPSPFHAWCHW